MIPLTKSAIAANKIRLNSEIVRAERMIREQEADYSRGWVPEQQIIFVLNSISYWKRKKAAAEKELEQLWQLDGPKPVFRHLAPR